MLGNRQGGLAAGSDWLLATMPIEATAKLNRLGVDAGYPLSVYAYPVAPAKPARSCSIAAGRARPKHGFSTTDASQAHEDP